MQSCSEIVDVRQDKGISVGSRPLVTVLLLICRLATVGNLVFQEKRTCKKSSTNTVQAGMQSTKTPENVPQSDPNLDNMYMLLDPHLRPATPDLQDPCSRALFEEHKKLAQEYLKVQTELALTAQKKDKLLSTKSTEQQRQRESIRKLQIEKEGLINFRDALLKQRELLQGSNPQGPDEWVIVPRNDGEV